MDGTLPPIGRRVYNSRPGTLPCTMKTTRAALTSCIPMRWVRIRIGRTRTARRPGEQIYSPWGQKLVAGGYVDRFAGLSHRDQTGFGRHAGARLQLLGESLVDTRRRRRDTG